MREEIYILWLETLTPLQKDGFDLAPLPEIKVNGQPAVGVKVSSKGHADAKLYFDTHTHLLVKVERTAEDAGLKLDKEYLLATTRSSTASSCRRTSSRFWTARKASELTSASYKFPSKPDDSLFAKP